MLLLGEDNNISEDFGLYEDEKFILKEQNIEKDHENLVDKSLNTRSCVKDSLSKYTSQDKLSICKSSSFLKEVRFNE